MSFSDRYATALEAHLPGLVDDLLEIGPAELEADSTRGLSCFRDRRGPGLLVPERHGGGGATALEAVRCVRALGALGPSLSVATTMHNFSVAAMVSVEDNFEGFEWMLLDAIANDRLLISSAFAEGLTGQGFMSPTMRADRTDTGGWMLNGSKRPCSLSRSMDLMSASVELHENDSVLGMGIIVIPSTLDGISVRPFWDAPVLRGAESDEVVLTDVEIPDELMVRPDEASGLSRDAVEARGLIWFTLLISAAYVGMASVLVDRLYDSGKGSTADRTAAACELEAATLALERVACVVDEGGATMDAMPQALVARHGAQGAVRRAVSSSVELLGGMRFITDPMVGYLAAATNALAFHPPSRNAMFDELDGTFHGK